MRNPFKFLSRQPKATPPPKEVYEFFRGVLDSNNHALDVMTDMGEKLGGGYLFDEVYVKGAYADLAGFMRESIRGFKMLTGGGQPALDEAFSRIDSRIRKALDETEALPARLLIPFEEITADMSREAGGKNASLAELGNRAKLNVPRGFALTTHAFDEFMRHNGLDLKAAGIARRGKDGEASLPLLQEMIESAEIPPGLGSAIDAALKDLNSRRPGVLLAVRSSAEEEDGEFSFAGQFTTVLGVPAQAASVKDAYRKVVASLYSPGAFAYQRGLGYDPGRMKMAVGCVEMVDAAASGVVFTAGAGGDRDAILISAAWGLGTSVVEGRVDADTYRVGRTSGAGVLPAVIERHIGKKEGKEEVLPGGGTKISTVPADIAASPCLADEQVIELVNVALRVERHLGGPQDIEWALGKDGVLYILQSRPLRMADAGGEVHEGFEVPASAMVLMSGRGVAVQGGAGAGQVYLLPRGADPDDAPDGAVLVSEADSPQIARAAHRLAAVITDTGTTTSHMASVCREFRLPTLVNTGDATKVLSAGLPVTLHIDEEGKAVVYEGVIRGVVERARQRVFGMESVDEYRKKRRILRHISPLNLVDPALDNFSPEGCRTLHDVLRFIHEKSVAELVESSKRYGERMKGRAPVRLDLPIPAGILVIDIGDGLDNPQHKDHVSLDEVRCLPLKSIVNGMIHPGVWHSDMVSMKVGDFLSSMVRMPDIAASAEDYTGYNVAVVSSQYVNMSLRFGYHFNMLDCYMSENARNSHIYFRFAGGATDIAKRSRRIHLISVILREYGFNITAKGDLVIARLSNLPREKMEEILDQLGRLVSYTRQLDAVLHTDASVERYASKFIKGEYNISA